MGKLGDSVGFFVTALIYIALLYVLVQPGSNASTAIATLTGTTGALTNLIKAATGGGSFSSSGTSSGGAGSSTPAVTTGGKVTVV